MSWCRIELQEIELHELVYLHYGGIVSTSVAVVWRRENCDHVALVCPVVTTHDQLMGAGDSLQVVRVIELLRDILSETIASSSWRDTPTTSVIRVGPEQVADRSFVGCLLDTIQLSDLIQSVNTRGETSMKAEDLVLDDSSQRQVVKELSELLPDIGVAVLAQALIVKAIPVIKRID